MRENAQKRIINWLNTSNTKMLFEKRRKHLYNKLKEEIIFNIHEMGNYPDSYKYLLDLRLYFKEIYQGYFYKKELQLSLNFFAETNVKKTI